MGKRTLWICRTALMIAALVALQFATKSLGQFVTGSCVNMVLVIACVCGGFWCGAVTALLSPLLAYALGIGPAFIQLVPAIAVGNLSLVAVYALLDGRIGNVGVRCILQVLLSSAVKVTVLYILIVKLLIPVLALPDKQAAVMSLMFSWPQFVTALIGGSIGTVIAQQVKKSFKAAHSSP